jgi:uncharacterized protein YbbC (DUF1343 family)
MYKLLNSYNTKIFTAIIVFCLVAILADGIEPKKIAVFPGAYQTKAYFPLLAGKSIGLVANQTSVINKTHLADSLLGAGFNLKKIFAPEHGFRGNAGPGEEINNAIDQKTGVPVISLYGRHSKPDSSDIKGIDVLIFDIQDVGVRFYTYISTLQYVMEACAENKIPLIVLDRPNPNGFYIDGPVLEKKFTSFVGMQPVPVVYGMTIGEYAMMLNGENWIQSKAKCDLKVIPVRNYNHSILYSLPVPPSPNLPDMDAVYLYPSVCFFEGTKISLGRGTPKPFRMIGFPGNKKGTVSFTPKDIPGVIQNPPYEDTLCKGMDLSGMGKRIVLEKRIKLNWLIAMYTLYPKKEKFFNNFFENLAGTGNLRAQMILKKSEDEIRKSWTEAISHFKTIRKKYLLYPDFE